jgi:CRP/FNR family transcriptional regulator
MDIDIILAQTHFFQGLGDEGRRALAEVAIPRSVRKRDVLFREGDEGHSLYLLNRGRIQLVKRAPDDAEVVIKTVKAGETFAEIVLFESQRYPVTAVALTECMIFLFPKRDIRRLLAREDFRDDFLAMLMRRQRFLAERIVELTSTDVEARFARFVLEHYGDRPSIEMDLSKKDVAAAIGTTPETLSRLLNRLETQGRIAWKGKLLIRPSAGQTGRAPRPPRAAAGRP